LNNASNPLRRRLVLLLALLAVLGFTLAGPQQPAALHAACTVLTNNIVLVYYYSDATYTTKVGQCYHSCCQSWTCSGTLTQYSKIIAKEQCD
jgi:predicted lipoprotein with Yx(FWY)xxD motif